MTHVASSVPSTRPASLPAKNMKATLRIALVFTLALSTLASAAPEKEAAKPEKAAAKATAKSEEKKDHYPLYGQVVSVNTRTLTIKGGEGKEDRKFAISAATEILKDDKPAKVEDVKVGQWVGGYVAKAESGNDKLLKLNLSAKQKEDKPAAKKDGSKPESKPAAAPKKAA